MKDKHQLKEFYEKELVGILRRYENIRVSILAQIHKYAVALLVIGILATLAIIIFVPVKFKFLAFLPILGASSFHVMVRRYFTRTYRTFFKDDIIERIIRFVDSSFEYYPKKHIESPLYDVSKLFTDNHNSYQGKDLVKGQIGKTKFMFSELHTEYTGARGQDDERPVDTIFKGIYFMGDFNKDFDGYTLVIPRTGTRFFNKPAKFINDVDSRANQVKLEDPEFESMFVVYGTDQIEARYILTPGLMQRIKNYKYKTGKEIGLSFVCSYVFVAISLEDDIFEPKLYETLLDFGPIEEYYDDLMLAVSIIEELNLNLRIWSKQ